MGSRIAAELVGDKLPGWFPLMPQDLSKETFRGPAISAARHQNIDYVPVLIHRSPQITTLPSDREEELVNVPDVPQSSLLSSQRAGIVRAKLAALSPDGFVGDENTSLGEQVLDITETEREPMVQKNGVADDLGREAVTAIS